MVYSKLRRHKVMEKVIKKLMANNLPPRFKFKDTYDSIEVPAAYQQHMPTQQEIEDEFDTMLVEEETMPTVAPATDELKIISSNVYSNVSTGKFGIGTPNPAYELDVVGDINFTGDLYQGGAPFVSSLWTAGADSLYYRSNVEVGTGNLFVDTTTSNVGIGTTTPAYELDVVGDINFSGNLYQDGSIFVSGGGGGGGGGSTLWNESNVELTNNGTLTLVFDDQAPTTRFTGTLGGNKVPTTAVRDTTNRYIILTYNTNSIVGTVYWQTTLTSSWEAEFEIKAIDKSYGGADDMRFIFFSQNPMTSTDYGLGAPFIKYEYYNSDVIEIWEPSSSTTDSMVQSASWSMPMSQWLPVKITYNNGVFTSVIKNSSGTILNTITRNFGTTYSSLHDVPTYVGITGRSGGVIAEDYVRNITIKATNVTNPIYVQSLNTSNKVGIGKTNPVYDLDVVGDINFTGKLYENGVEFGGGSTAVSQGSGSTLYLLTTPIIDEWSWSSSANTLRITYPTSEIPANCKAVLAEVFLPKTNIRDHVGHSLGKNYSETTVWTSNYQQPSSRFTLNRQTTFLDMRGDSDGYDYYYGKWFSSVIIPLDTNNTVYHVVQGESASTVGWVYVVTRGYYI